MINKIILYPCVIFVYHLALLVLPINLFLIGLRIPLIIQVFPWLFTPFLILSPVLTFLLALRATPAKSHRFAWIFPVAVSLIGYSPLIVFYFLIANNLRDYALVLSFPTVIGLAAFRGSCFLRHNKRGILSSLPN